MAQGKSYPLVEKLFWVALDEYTLNDSLLRNLQTSRLRYLLCHFTDQFGSNRHQQTFFIQSSNLYSLAKLPSKNLSWYSISGVIYSFDLGFPLWSRSWFLCPLSVAYQAFNKCSWYFSISLHTTSFNSGDLPQANMMHCLHYHGSLQWSLTPPILIPFPSGFDRATKIIWLKIKILWLCSKHCNNSHGAESGGSTLEVTHHTQQVLLL